MAEARVDVKRWEALGDGITDAIVAISHERRKPQEKQDTPEWYQKQRLKIDRGLNNLWTKGGLQYAPPIR